MINIEYITSSERDTIIQEQIAIGNVLIEEQNHLDGNYLIFYSPSDIQAQQITEAREALALLFKNRPELIIGLIAALIERIGVTSLPAKYQTLLATLKDYLMKTGE